MEVIWLRRARQHLVEIITYIANDSPTAAIAVRQRIEEAARSLATHPESGRQGRIDGTRELVIHGLPYIMPYRVRHGRVEILAVLHAARRWPTRL